MRIALLAVLAAAAGAAGVTACGSSSTPPEHDTGPHAGDTGVKDAGAEDVPPGGEDAPNPDAEPPDLGPPDTGTPDAGTPPAIVAFAADMTSVTAGTAVNLVWNVTNADTISISANPGGAVLTNSTMVHGMQMTMPLQMSTSFTLIAMNGSGSVMQQIFVGVDPGMPMITDFHASPNPAPLNGTTTLSWTTTNSTRVRILQGATVLFDTNNLVNTGSWMTGPLPDAQNAFTLEASNFAHMITNLLIVNTQ